MQRRSFLKASAAAVLAPVGIAQTPKNEFFHLTYYYMRSGPQVDRTTQYLSGVFAPAAKRAGMGSVGLFSPVIAERTPFLLSLICYPSLASMETLQSKLTEDKEFSQGWAVYSGSAEPAYVRKESILLRAFDKIPALEAPPTTPERAPRIFELRTYESISEVASRRKIKMFEDGEAAIFRRLGMLPVFFGRGLLGSNLPSLTYMLAYDDLAARERLWRNFGADPEWQKLRAQPGLSDAEIVSNISTALLRPLPASGIR